MRVQVLVRLKPGVLDVQGKAVEGSIKAVGFGDITNIRVGKLIEFEMEGSDFDSAKPKIEDLCKKILANTIIENFEIRKLE